MSLQKMSPDAMHAQELEQYKAIIRQQDADLTALKAKLVGRHYWCYACVKTSLQL